MAEGSPLAENQRGIGGSHLSRNVVNVRYYKMVGLVERMLDPSAGSELALRNSKGRLCRSSYPRPKPRTSENPSSTPSPRPPGRLVRCAKPASCSGCAGQRRMSG